MQIYMWIWNMCGNIFHFHFSVASGHDNADSYANMNYLWEYFSAAFFFCCIQPYSVTTLKAISDFIILHKTKKMIILWEVNARKVRSTFGEKHYLFAYLPEGLRSLLSLRYQDLHLHTVISQGKFYNLL